MKADAKGKHLFVQWEQNGTLHIHLGLYGRVRRYRETDREARGQIRVRFTSDEVTTDFHGPNRCELLASEAATRKQAQLGEDPLRSDSEPRKFVAKLRTTRLPIGAVLLDQSVIAGLGNIYRSEVHFLCQIHPSRPSNEITEDEAILIWKSSCELLKIGLKYNRIIIPPVGGTRKSLGRSLKNERLQIDKKELCVRCSTKVESWNLAQRKVFACSTCQY